MPPAPDTIVATLLLGPLDQPTLERDTEGTVLRLQSGTAPTHGTDADRGGVLDYRVTATHLVDIAGEVQERLR